MNDNGRVVCAWYTPDYAHWADALKVGLDRHGERHDIVEVEKMAGGWERNTMRKPHQIMAAMKRHPTDTVIFLDVDCEVLESLAALAKIKGDIGLYFCAKVMRNGVARINARSGTIVLRNTPAATRFVRKWMELGRRAPKGTVDQHTLPIAIAETPDLSVTMLDNRFCAIPCDKVINPVILHDNASRNTPKIPKFARVINRLFGRLEAAESSSIHSCSR